jgi:NADPH:quinone reductase-like Zn-dependent oxidoreductase
VLAATIEEFGGHPNVIEVPDPAPANGESLVRVEAATITHLDLGVAGGRFPVLPDVPYVPGTGGSGRVVESAAFAAGTLVEIRGAGIGLSRDGTWAELVAAPDEALHHHPETDDPIVAATFYSAFNAAHIALHEVGQLEPGERVIVTGAAGSVGAMAAHLALRGGAGSVLGVISSEARRTGVPEGVEVIIGPDDAAAIEPPADLLVDTVGGDSLLAVLPRVRPGGRAAVVGYTKGESVSIDLPSFMYADVSLLPVNGMRWRALARDSLAAAARAEVIRGDFPRRVETYPLARASEAFAAVADNRARGRVVLLPAARIADMTEGGRL